MQKSKAAVIKRRAVSMLIAVAMVLMSLPASLIGPLKASSFPFPWGWPGMFGPNVLTNVSVSFYDSKFKAIDEVESGKLFYLSVQLSGNNVNHPNLDDVFRLEITDSNLLLPNFSGNGFVDGAEYNGFTLHVREDGTRYLEYSIKNGDTKMIRLQAKFANGTTPDDTTNTVKLVQATTGRSVSNTITVDSTAGWTQSKSESTSHLSGDAVKDGATVEYTLSASSTVGSKTTGAWWAKEIHFQDSLSGYEPLTAEVGDIEAAIKAAGFTDYKINSTEPGNIDFVVYSNDESKEMGNVNVKVPVKFTGTAPDEGLTVKNEVDVKMTLINDTEEKPVGSSEVELEITAPTPPPEPAPSFTLEKSVDVTQVAYEEMSGDGEEKTVNVEYTIKVANNGNADGTITLTEHPGTGITLDAAGQEFEAGKEVTLAAGEEKTFTFSGTITASGAGSFGNRISGGNLSANANTNVTKKEARINASKSGYVNEEGNNWFSVGDTVYYTITIKNEGELDKTVEVEDPAPAGVEEWTQTTGLDLSAVNVPAGETVEIRFEGKVAASAGDSIQNTAKVDGKDVYGPGFQKN